MRFFAKLLASGLIIFVTLLAILLASLHTSYGLPLVKNVANFVLDGEFDAQAMDYSLSKPLRIAFTAPSYRYTEQVFSVNQLDVTFPLDILRLKPHLRAVAIEGLTLDQNSSDILPASLTIDELTITDFSFAHPSVAISNAKLQLTNWRKANAQWGQASGKMQLDAQAVTHGKLRFNDVLIDSEFQNNRWEIWGFSFGLGNANVNGSATLEPHKRITFQQLTVSDAIVQNEQYVSDIAQLLSQTLASVDIDIQRTDILNFNAEWDNISVNSLNLSAQELSFKAEQPWWLQKNALVSFNASYIGTPLAVANDPIAEMYIAPDTLHVSGFSAKLLEGFLSFEGTLTSQDWQFDRFTANGLQWEIGEGELTLLQKYADRVQNVHFDDLSVSHTVISRFKHEFPIQINGLNVNGEKVSFKRNGHYGIWEGTLTASARMASINRQVVLEPYLEAANHNGEIQLKELLLPFPNGQLKLDGSIAKESISEPWQLNIEGLNVPLSLYHNWLQWPLPLVGEHDIEGRLHGLAGDTASFNYSLTGNITTAFHQLQLSPAAKVPLDEQLKGLFRPKQADDLSLFPSAITASTANLTLDRGRLTSNTVTVSSASETARINIDWDLVSDATPEVKTGAP